MHFKKKRSVGRPKKINVDLEKVHKLLIRGYNIDEIQKELKIDIKVIYHRIKEEKFKIVRGIDFFLKK